MFIEKGIEYNIDDDYPILYSIKNHYHNIVKYLLSFYREDEITLLIKNNKNIFLQFLIKTDLSKYDKLIIGCRNNGIDMI